MAAFKQRSRLFLVLVLIFILTVTAVIYIEQYQTKKIITELIIDRVYTANSSFVNYLTELEDRVKLRTEVVAVNETVISAIKSGDQEYLKRVLTNFIIGFDFSSICDAEGIVLARTHSDVTGDNISEFNAISSALYDRVISSSIQEVQSFNNRLSIYASAPIYDGGVLIGVVNCFYDLTNNQYVDRFKERTGCEATIFLKDVRISTTITDESGRRANGTKAFDFIAEAVLEQQLDYTGNLELYGKMYGVCYSPLMIEGEVIGMLFTGVDIAAILESQHSMNSWSLRASFIGVIISMAIFFISGKILNKYANLSDRQLNQQILMANISRRFLSDTDIDVMITDTLRMVGEFLNIPQVLLFWLENDGFTLTCRNEWINPKLGLKSRLSGKMPLKEPMLSMIKGFRPDSGKDACLSSNDEVVKKAMAPYRVNFKNYIATPVFIKGEMCAVIDFSREDSDLKWSESDTSLATLFASTLSGVFEREAMGRKTSVVENSPLMIFYSDAKGHLVYANPAASAVTGYTYAELKAGGFSLILDETSMREVKDRYIPQTFINGVIKHETVLVCKDGRRRILEVTSFIVEDGMTAAICMDLTETRALEAELIKAKDNAELASRAKSDFLSNMSHEMRTPMNAIIGMASIARKAEDNERKDYALNKVEESSKHLLGIINDVLDMSKIEANKFELTYVEFDLRSLLQKAVSFVRLRMDEKQHKFSMNVDEDVPFFYVGDDQRLAQVITNLLSNAAKFTPEDGKIGVKVSLAGEEDGVCELCFEVYDSGIGISPEQQEKIFNIFEQAESGTTRKYGGTGLGLAISKRIIELMGGQISIDSDLGKGSRFIFTVKLLRDKNDYSQQSDGEKPSVPFSASRKGEFAGKKLLLAEDIEINREILISLLDETGLIINIAENGREALEKIAADFNSYDLVFMDVQMPEMDGLEATKRIRTFEANMAKMGSPVKRLPIIAMTANVFKDDIENCLTAGMDDHIGKPLEIDTVYEKLRKFL